MQLVRCCVLLLLFASIAQAQADSATTDSDNDGLPDSFESEILERFRPTFMISATDCAIAPAQFVAGNSEPTPTAVDGTIYGQVSPAPNGPTGSERIEIHYYHLWAQDCGRIGHPLDAEHVSVLVEKSPDNNSSDWHALYWYAAAHENTLCDSSTGASARSLKATTHGAKVWVSNGKHASFLAAEDCRRGCGGDRCEQMITAPVSTIINLGEQQAPMNGAVWMASNRWPLLEKLGRSDFRDEIILRIKSGGDHTITVDASPAAVKSTILAGNSSVDGVNVGKKHTSSALAIAKSKTTKSLRLSYFRTKNALSFSKTN